MGTGKKTAMTIKSAANQAVKLASDPVYKAQQEGRNKSGYSSGSAGGPLMTVSAPSNSSSGSSGSGKRSSTATSNTGTSIDWTAYYNSLRDQANAAADDAYNNNMSRIASMYNNVAGNIGGNYDSTVGRLKAARDQSLKDVNNDAESSLRQAYINSELTKRGLNQRLSAMGYNGGATESTMADLANEYSRSRGGINTTRNKNIADLNKLYQDNLAAALQAYNNAMSNLEMQRMSMENEAENARLNSMSGDVGGFAMDSGYVSALQSALANQLNYQYDPSQATNDFIPGNVQQAQSMSEGTNYAKWLQEMQQLAANGQGANIQSTLFNAIRNGDLDLNSAYRIMNSIGR